MLVRSIYNIHDNDAISASQCKEIPRTTTRQTSTLPIQTIHCSTRSLEESGKITKRENALETSVEILQTQPSHSAKQHSLPLPQRQSIAPCITCSNSQIEGTHLEKSVAESSNRAPSSSDSTKHTNQETSRDRRNKLHKTIVLMSSHLLPQVKQLCKATCVSHQEALGYYDVEKQELKTYVRQLETCIKAIRDLDLDSQHFDKKLSNLNHTFMELNSFAIAACGPFVRSTFDI